ncbi:MAG: polymerase [Desulfosporosinus sp. BICA1-9]|nr:MAG: polymerase [Desulfosporosinus sp. BICA1-9]
MLKWLFFLASVATVLYWGWKKPAVLIWLLAGAIALEISIEWFPPLGPLGSQINSLARLLTLGIIGAALRCLWIEPEKRRELKVILTHYLTRALMIYIVVGALSFLYSVDRSNTVVEVVRLLTLFSLYLSIGLLTERKHILWPFRVVHWVGVAMVPLALYEGVTRHFIWRGYLAEGMIARVNATFVDPNIFARYLILAIVANLILQYLNTEVRKRIIYMGSLLGLLGGLAITLSRSGLLTLAMVLVLMLLLIPRKKMILPIGFLGLIGTVILAMRPTIWQRLLTFREGFGALDAQRQYLWKAAWAMFTDHPVVGVGLGGFQKMFLTQYLYLKTVIPDVEGATLSHTTLLTIAAELGLIGLAALTWVWLALMRVLWRLRKGGLEHSRSKNQSKNQNKNRNENGNENGSRNGSGNENENEVDRYITGVGYFLWITTVFISSQAEARFFEDPLIWISMGMLFSIADNVGSEKKREPKITAS